MDTLKILVLAATVATLLPIRSVYGNQSLRGPPSAADHLPTERELIIGGQDAKEKNEADARASKKKEKRRRKDTEERGEQEMAQSHLPRDIMWHDGNDAGELCHSPFSA